MGVDPLRTWIMNGQGVDTKRGRHDPRMTVCSYFTRTGNICAAIYHRDDVEYKIAYN